MKKLRIIIIELIFICNCSCESSMVFSIEDNPIVENSLLKKTNLKVLDIGNSYTNDATAYLPLIIDKLGVDVTDFCLYKVTYGGASFKKWFQVYNDQGTGGYVFTKVIGGGDVTIAESTAKEHDGSLFRRILTEEQWDIIIIHQLGRYSTSYDEWKGHGDSGYLEDLLSIIKKNQPEAAIGFLFTHSPESSYPTNEEKSSMERWEHSAAAVIRLIQDYDIKLVIPYGTAIQNLRKTEFNNNHELTRDGAHLGQGLARYTAACCYYESLISPRTGVTILGKDIPYEVDDDTETSKISVTENNMGVAQKAAELAYLYPFMCLNPNDYILEKMLKAIYK